MHQKYTLTSLLLWGAFSTAAPNPLRQTKRDTGSSTLPYCYYDEVKPGTGQCSLANKGVGFPNPAYCQQSMAAVCSALSQLPANNGTIFAYDTGDGTLKGPNADCVATANNGDNLPTLDYATCMSKFQQVAGCTETTNQGYNPDCVGGSINEQFNTNDPGKAVDYSQPRFGIGTPYSLGFVDSGGLDFNHPDPQLQGDRTNGQGANAGVEPAEAAGTAKTPSTAGKPGGFIAGGFLGSEIGD